MKKHKNRQSYWKTELRRPLSNIKAREEEEMIKTNDNSIEKLFI